ncbi:MAG: hypothetical protein K8T10_17080 [Candidatus Eremiobacteraeota bacterium]|nr:hypothetical protein [Candidatus Eremiobacteraeota bacterium]
MQELIDGYLKFNSLPIKGLMGFLFSICILCIFLLVGKLLRVKIKLFQKLFLPSSIIAGFVALIIANISFTGSSVIKQNEILNWPVLIQRIQKHEDPVNERIWNLLDTKTQALITSLNPKSGDSTKTYLDDVSKKTILVGLNAIISNRDFYQNSFDDKLKLPAKCNKIKNKGMANINEKEVQKFNRLVLESVYPETLATCDYRIVPSWIMKDWKPLPGVLINIVFASLFLGVALPNLKTLWNYGGPQLCYGVVMGMGQYFIALLVTVLVLTPLFHVPTIFACIVEIGFSGGHGTAAGMREVFTKLGFPAGGDLGQMSATVGIISAVVFGIILINIAIRKGYCACLNEKKGIPTYKKTGLIPEAKRFSIATATVATEAIEPLTFHFGIIAIAIIIGWVMWVGVKNISPILDSFPLFPLAMIGGLIVQAISAFMGIDKYYDRDTFDRILGFSLDVLVISAIASIRLDLLLQNIWPFLIIMFTGISWALFCTVFLAPRMFPKYWFERGITEYGMQTGVTAIGLLLLRIVDPLYKTGTATAFGFKQMVYEPFLGGGLITALAPIIVVSLGKWPSIGVAFAIMLIFFFISYFSGWVNFKPHLKFED